MSGGSHIPISLFHILLVGPFFIYVAYVRGQLMPWIFNVLLGLGLVIFVYHASKAYLKYQAKSFGLWVNVIHMIAVAPLLVYIGIRGYDTPRWAFEVLAMLGFSAIGYHIYSILVELQDREKPKKILDDARD